MTWERVIAIIAIWMAPTIAIIYTKGIILGWIFLLSVWGTEYVTNWNEYHKEE